VSRRAGLNVFEKEKKHVLLQVIGISENSLDYCGSKINCACV